jgi:PKHD-type hydroxylase
LSGIITLSDPKDYTGGELEIKTSENKIIKIGKQPRGTMMVFPSFLQHRVKPVTSGTRHTLVMWARGENFK